MTAIYQRLGVGYAQGRRPDPRWQAAIDLVLGDARTVLNVGAGTGSYEPRDRFVLAVEPAPMMIGQRRPQGAPAVQACAGRVAARLVVLHFDPVMHGEFWLARDYLPELAELWREVPTPDAVAEVIGAGARARVLPVPADCVDGFLPAFWRRPEAYLDPDVRRSMSGLQLLPPEVLARGLEALRTDLDDGSWQRRNAGLLDLDELDVG